MYLDHFGLKEAPFSITPDPRFVFLSDRHREALAHLVYGISQGGSGGFVLLTGEVGTGKTTLSRLLLAQLPENTRVALVLNPRLTAVELLETICEELGVDTEGVRGSGKGLIDRLNRFLLDAHAHDLRIVLVLDEAQQLSVDSLEQVRLLTNLETATHKLLQIVLLGQPELRELLNRPDLRQLAQRITARYHLTPLDESETATYVAHRLAVAGRSRSPFTPSALRCLHRRSGGIPRLINVIAERSLLAGYARDLDRIDPAVVTSAADELQVPAATGSPWPPALVRTAAVAAAVTAVLALVLWSPWRSSTPVEPPQAEATNAAESPLEPAPQRIEATLALSQHLRALAEPADASVALLAIWQANAGLAERVASCPFDLAPGLYCVRGQGNVEQLALFDRPVLVALGDGARTHAVLLTGLDAQVVHLDTGSGAFAVARDEFVAAWSGDYLALLRLPSTVPAILNTSVPAWAGQALDRFEANRSLLPLSEQEQRIRRLQLSYGLRADAVVGPETWWALSTWLDGGPRLQAPPRTERQ